MKNFIIFVFIVFQISIVAKSQGIEIKASRMHGLLIFVFSNADRPHYSPYLKEYTEKSEFKEQMKNILSGFSDIDRSLSRDVSYRLEGSGYGDSFSVSDLAEIQSAYADNIDDLMSRLQHTIPVEDWLKLQKILKAVEPIYEKLIWSENSKDLLAIEKVYQSKLDLWKVNHLFSNAQKFYNTTWPSDLKFHIALYPIPKGAKHSNAHSLSAFESVGIIIGEKDIEGRFGVMFHEMMHSLYSAQPFEFKEKLLSYYNLNKNDSELPFRKGAQKFSNEIFATVLGNGWFYDSVSGHVDQFSWYNEPHIELPARGMYELTKSYLSNGKSIDEVYVQKLIAQFKMNFPNYGDDPDYIFQSVEIQHTGNSFKSTEIRNSFRSKFRTVNLGISGSSSLLKDKRRLLDDGTTLILLSMTEAKSLLLSAKAKLDLPNNIFKIAKKANSGLWKWTDKKGHIRVLGIADIGRLDELFSNGFGK